MLADASAFHGGPSGVAEESDGPSESFLARPRGAAHIGPTGDAIRRHGRKDRS